MHLFLQLRPQGLKTWLGVGGVAVTIGTRMLYTEHLRACTTEI